MSNKFGLSRESLLRTFWYGGSTLDAWMNFASAKIATRILTAPQTTAQLGLPSALVFQFSQAIIGLWCQCMIHSLYLEYKRTRRPQHIGNRNGHTTQFHEVIGGLLGPRWGAVSLFLNAVILFHIASTQILNSSSVVYRINKGLDRRTWTSVFSAIFFLTIFTPSARNYRTLSFIGVITTIFTSAYMTISALAHEQHAGVEHYFSPQSFREYFTGVSGCIFMGTMFIPVEIMEAMWKPQEYKVVAVGGTLYIIMVVTIPSIAMSLKFGNTLLSATDALALLPQSKFFEATIVLLLIHVFIVFGLYSFPVYTMSEKLLRVHNSSKYATKIASRVPVFLAMWLMAMAFPFFGIVRRVVDSALVTWNFYIIPCAAYNVVFWPERQRKDLASFSRLGWAMDFSVNLGIIFWVVIIECGMGLWASTHSLVEFKGVKVFAKCFGC